MLLFFDSATTHPSSPQTRVLDQAETQLSDWEKNVYARAFIEFTFNATGFKSVSGPNLIKRLGAYLGA